MNLEHFFNLNTDHMYGEDAVSATASIQKGESNGVVINCPGGSIHSFMDDAVAMTDQHFTALGIFVGSLAVEYYLCAGTRLATPHSTFFLHHPSVETKDLGDQTLEQLLWKYEISRALIETHRPSKFEWRTHRRLIRLILGTAECQHFGVRWVSKRTGLEPGIVDQLMRDEVTLTASEALELGLVHHIIEL